MFHVEQLLSTGFHTSRVGIPVSPLQGSVYFRTLTKHSVRVADSILGYHIFVPAALAIRLASIREIR